MGTSARHRGARASYADERRAARRAEVAALCSLVVVLLWGACLIPLPAGKAPSLSHAKIKQDGPQHLEKYLLLTCQPFAEIKRGKVSGGA